MISRNIIKLNNLLRRECCFKGINKWYSSQATATAAKSIPYEKALRRAKPLSEMPAPPMLPYIGSAWLYFPIIGRYDRKKLHVAFRQNRQWYGNIYRDKIGPLNLVVSFEAEDMETVFRNEGPYPFRSVMSTIKTYRVSRKHWYKAKGLSILQGKEWHYLRSKTQRHLMKPKAVQAYVGSMQNVAHDFVQRMEKIKDSKNEVPDFLKELYKWSLESVAYVGLDARLGCFENSDSDGIKMINAVQTQFELLNKLESVRGNIQLWKWFPTPNWRKFVKASDVFSEIAFKYINQACDKLNKVDKNEDKELTLLQAMLATEGLALDGAMVMVADMLFAGIDTTAHTSGFLLYELAKNSDKQELLYQEINKILSSTGGKLTQAVFPDLKYLKSCLKESLRSYFGIYSTMNDRNPDEETPRDRGRKVPRTDSKSIPTSDSAYKNMIKRILAECPVGTGLDLASISDRLKQLVKPEKPPTATKVKALSYELAGLRELEEMNGFFRLKREEATTFVIPVVMSFW